MSIENVGQLNKMLKEYNSQDWIKSAAIEQKNLPSFGDLNPFSELGNKSSKSFSELLASSLSEVNSMQEEANKAIQRLASGQTKNISETMLAVENAELAFKTMNQVRMKVIEAYKEIMRMQI